MYALILTIACLFINLLVGAVVWTAMDDRDKRLYRWYAQAPSVWLCIAVLELWFVGAAVLLYYHVDAARRRRRQKTKL